MHTYFPEMTYPFFFSFYFLRMHRVRPPSDTQCEWGEKAGVRTVKPYIATINIDTAVKSAVMKNLRNRVFSAN